MDPSNQNHTKKAHFESLLKKLKNKHERVKICFENLCVKNYRKFSQKFIKSY